MSVPYVEKYRPKELTDLIADESVISKFQEFIDNESIPHLLLVGNAGQGKTTSAKILANKITEDILYINASDETSVETIRNKVKGFCSTIGFGSQKIVILDECLEENEKVLIGKVGSYVGVSLKDLDIEKEYDIVSFNMNTGLLENDRGRIISDKNDYVFEVELEDGRTIKCNENHPFLVKDNNGKCVERKLKDLKEGDEIIVG